MSSDDIYTNTNTQTLEEELLCSSRTGDVEKTRELLRLRESGIIEFNINVKGQQKSNSCWSPLHLASYFGHYAIAELLINHGADVNIVNDTGDTPLHKASYTDREEIVFLLLSKNANVFIKNGEGQTARDVCRKESIKTLLKAAEETDLRKKNDTLLHASREGDTLLIEELLRADLPPDVNCKDSLGNTALHCAAYRGKKEVAVLLLQNGIDPSIKNSRGQLAIDLAINLPMKQILGVQPVKHLQKTAARFEGPLLRKSRFLGWREIWTVLEKGVLSFFTSRADASTGSRRKGYKYLDGAEVLLDENDIAAFVIQFSNNRRQRFCVPFVTYQQLDRQKWVNAITEHIEFSTYYLKQGMLDSEGEEDTDVMPLGSMQNKLQTAQAHQQLLENHIEQLKPIYHCLVRHMGNGDIGGSLQAQESPWSNLPYQLDKLIDLSRKVSSSLSHCLTIFSQQEEVRLLQVKQLQEQVRVYQDALHALAQEHHELEKSFVSPFHSPPKSPLFVDTDCDEFFDAYEGDYSPPEPPYQRKNSKVYSPDSVTENDATFFASFSSATASFPEPTQNVLHSKWGRAYLPVPMFSRNDFSVWSILKQCIGRELSKITMPVVFNEPLSFLQRLSENMEYCGLLDQASNCEDPVRRMEYVSAFAVAAIASNWDRLGKPFNPLLGETFEFKREDMGFRIICEQVSHHPPVSAFHADSSNFIFHGAIHPKLKLWARSVEIKPEGTVTVKLLRHNEIYTWSGVNCCVHNIIVGKLWMEQCGTMEVTCHTNGLTASLNFKQAGWFCKDLNCVEGFICDRQKTKLRFIFGKWCSYLKSASIENFEEYIEAEKTNKSQKDKSNMYVSLEGSDSAPSSNRSAFENLSSTVLWEAEPRPDFSSEYYNFTSFAMALNELPDDMSSNLAPTDSRLRPDIRRLEEGDLDGAAEEKNRLEEKQREARKQRKKDHSVWQPLWFESVPHQYAKETAWVYKGGYWEKNFSNCADIF